MANMPRKLDQLIILFAAFIMVCSITEATKPNVTHIEFYLHDVTGGSNPTAVRVAGRVSNYTGSDPIAASYPFGSVYVLDDLLTMTPDPNSTVVGRAQGTYVVSSSQYSEFSLHMSLTYVFSADGPYNGSTFSIVGRNPAMKEVRELPVVGGTGLFRLAHGYCFVRTHSMDQNAAIMGYNVTLILNKSEAI